MQYVVIFLASFALDFLSTLWTRAVTNDSIINATTLAFFHDSLSWVILFVALTTDWTTAPFAIIGTTMATPAAMLAARALNNRRG